MEGKTYGIGLRNNPKLVIEDNDILYYSETGENVELKFEFNKRDYSTKVFVRKLEEDIFVESTKYEIIKDVKEVLSEDGTRWEGDWYNGQPFGFGSVYDGEGNRIYVGFMVESRKVGFGTEYFADTHTVDYCGNFLNDKRHGWGCSYDRNGNKLFEGDWRFGKNNFEERIEIRDKNGDDCLEIHDLIKELVIGEKCFNKKKRWGNAFVIENLTNLEKIVVKKNSLMNLNLLKICNCEKLMIIKAEDRYRWDAAFYNVKNGGFYNVKKVIIESI